VAFAHHIHKAILSQFSKTKKATDDSSDPAEDEDEDEGDEEQEEDNEEHEVDDGDEVDSAVAASDDAMVDQVAKEVGADKSLPSLTRDQINLGRFSLSKVPILSVNKLSHDYQLSSVAP
jgi:hypothetical protein